MADSDRGQWRAESDWGGGDSGGQAVTRGQWRVDSEGGAECLRGL